MHDTLFDLAEFDVSSTLGFLPSKLASTLPLPYYTPWEQLGTTLPELLRQGTFREIVLSTPLLSIGRLLDVEEWRRAYVILGYLSNAYLFAITPPAEVSSQSTDYKMFF